MTIKHPASNATIATQVKEIKNIFQASIGLLKYRTPQTILLRTRFGIHTFGMKFPIDVIVLNNEGKVIAVKAKMKLYRVFFWHPRHNIVLEMESGAIEKHQIKLGDKLIIEY